MEERGRRLKQWGRGRCIRAPPRRPRGADALRAAAGRRRPGRHGGRSPSPRPPERWTRPDGGLPRQAARDGAGDDPRHHHGGDAPEPTGAGRPGADHVRPEPGHPARADRGDLLGLRPRPPDPRPRRPVHGAAPAGRPRPRHPRPAAGARPPAPAPARRARARRRGDRRRPGAGVCRGISAGHDARRRSRGDGHREDLGAALWARAPLPAHHGHRHGGSSRPRPAAGRRRW